MTEEDGFQGPIEDPRGPVRPRKNGRPFKYPWPRMQVGDKFTVPNTKISRVLSAAAQFVKRNKLDWKFSGETLPDGSVRVERKK